jgi:hypothetical protein
VLKLEVTLSIFSLLLLSASAFRDEERPYDILVWLGERCKKWINRVISGLIFCLFAEDTDIFKVTVCSLPRSSR